MFFKKNFTLLYFLLVFSTAIAQNSKRIDSLQGLQNPQNLSNHTRMKILSDSVRANQTKDPIKTLNFIKEGMDLALKTKDKTYEAEFLSHLGTFNWRLGDYVKSIEYTLQAYKIDESIGNLKGMARDLHNLGTVYDSKGEMDKALDYYEKSMQKDKEAKDSTQLSTTMNNIGVIYQRKEELFKALE
ncbi:MAG: tetratricopeptide repeat protein, partial [Thermoflexibacter sp.]|nr:tetratricopeptide repeat protein [Thermoflexibacter sp.]